MAMDEAGGRREELVSAIKLELERQGQTGIDADALASAVEQVFAPAPPASEGKHPDELNATNDD